MKPTVLAQRTESASFGGLALPDYFVLETARTEHFV
jgi:hypothetical protein